MKCKKLKKRVGFFASLRIGDRKLSFCAE